jgi:hypothetical protein
MSRHGVSPPEVRFLARAEGYEIVLLGPPRTCIARSRARRALYSGFGSSGKRSPVTILEG